MCFQYKQYHSSQYWDDGFGRHAFWNALSSSYFHQFHGYDLHLYWNVPHFECDLHPFWNAHDLSHDLHSYQNIFYPNYGLCHFPNMCDHGYGLHFHHEDTCNFNYVLHSYKKLFGLLCSCWNLGYDLNSH